jgi:hypothetical protein
MSRCVPMKSTGTRDWNISAEVEVIYHRRPEAITSARCSSLARMSSLRVRGAGVGGDGVSFEVVIVRSTEGVFLEMLQWLRENASWQNRYVTHYNKNYTAMTFSFFFDEEEDAVAFSLRFRGLLRAHARRPPAVDVSPAGSW